MFECSSSYLRPPTRVVCGGIFTRCRRHPSLQESGGVPLAEHGNPPTPSPPSATPQQTSCWDLLPPLASSPATIRGGGENTNRGINCLPPTLTSSSSCPVQCCSIIRQLFIPHQSTVPSCLARTLVRKVVPMDSWLSENMVSIAFILQQSDPERKP